MFQDFGGDLKLEDESFAYVDGSFQIELPVGEVYVDISKGFEFERVRQKITIDPKERELHLEIPRSFDLRKLGWVTADTHVHVLSPSTALLEAQAEGVNLINLLAAQIGKYFINVGDLAQGQLVSGDGEVLIRMGTENREHILGHIGLLGGSAPSFPMSAGGPPESSIGDPLWSTIAEWADQCQRRDGLTVAMHFPYPRGEWATNVVLNKLDAVELFPYSEHFSTLGFLDWYRYLNCGYRLPIVGGTDKMGAWTPVGANRTYANLGQSEFSFSNWAQAVRNGNTFISTGPVLLFSVEGHEPGHEIAVGAAGGTVEFSVTARSSIPFHRIEVIFNGEVVASREESRGTSRVDISDRIHVAGPGWLAARCVSQLASSSRLGSVPSRVWICAHTSPVYLVVPGQELFSPDVAAHLLTQIECAETYLKEIATRPESARFRESLGVFAQARKRLHDRMHEHQRSHEHP